MSEITNISHNTNLPNNLDEDNVANWYFRDYYWKDYLYISSDRFRGNQTKENNKIKHLVNEEVTCSFMFNLWAKEMLRGLKQFFYGGSLHGVKYIFEPTFSRKERAVWIVIVVISIAICAVNIIRLFSKWTSTPFVNVIDSLPTPIWAIPFPTVVLCPHLRLKLSYANVSSLKPLEEFFASNVCPRMTRLNRPRRLNETENIILQKFISEGSLKCSEVVKSCNWPAMHDTKWVTTECCEKLFRPVFTDYGLCYSFNNLPLNGMSDSETDYSMVQNSTHSKQPPTKQKKQAATKRKGADTAVTPGSKPRTNDTWAWQKSFSTFSSPLTLNWNLDGGYPITPPEPNMKPFRLMVSGEANGLGVELFLNNSEHQYACNGNSSGFTILIRSPTNHVYTSTVLRLPMEKMTTIEVSPITYKTDPGLRALDPEQRQCFFQNERKLEYFQFYTETNCKMDILMHESLVACNCSMFNWPRKTVQDPICSTKEDFECIDKTKETVTRQQIYAYYADSEEGKPSKSGSTSCHPSCNDVIYDSQVFYSDLIKEPGDPSPVWGEAKSGEITVINVHFYDDMFLGQHRHAQYDDYYFVGAIGGLLSLFLGFSIISVAELIYFVTLRPLYLVLRETVKDTKCRKS